MVHEREGHEVRAGHRGRRIEPVASADGVPQSIGAAPRAFASARAYLEVLLEPRVARLQVSSASVHPAGAVAALPGAECDSDAWTRARGWSRLPGAMVARRGGTAMEIGA